MRFLSCLVLSLFVFETTFAPLARAKEAGPRDISPALEKAFSDLDDADLQVRDKSGATLEADSFLEKAPKEFSIEGEEDIVYHVKVADIAKEISYTVVAKDADGKAIARRRFVIDPRKDAVGVQVQLEQTAKSLDTQVEAYLKTRHASRTSKVKLAGLSFLSLFGIPSAHAGSFGARKFIRTVAIILALTVLYQLATKTKGGTSGLFILGTVVVTILLLSGCDSAPSGYKRNPGYDMAPAHARQFIPKYVPDDDK